MPSALCSLLGTGAFAYVYFPLDVIKNLHAIVIYFGLYTLEIRSEDSPGHIRKMYISRMFMSPARTGGCSGGIHRGS